MATRTVSSSRLNNVITSEKALFFNGSSDFVSMPVYPSPNGCCIALWYFLPIKSGDKRVFNWESAGDRNGIYIRINTNTGQINFIGSNASGFTFNNTAGGNANNLVIGKWYHIVFTYIPGSQKVYINRSLKQTTTGATITTNGNTPTISKSAYSATFSTQIIKDFVFHNTTTPWTQDQINDLYYIRKIPTGANVWYKFDNNVNDSSGNGNTGTLTGGTYSTNVPSQFTARSSAGSRFVVNSINNSIKLGASGDSVGSLSFAQGSTYSMCFWANILSNGGGAAGRILDNNIGDLILMSGTQSLQIQHNSSGKTSSNNFIKLRNWTFYTITYDQNNINLYINGVLFQQIPQTVNPRTSTQTYYFFNRADGARWLDGYVSTFMYYKNRVLGLSEINDIYKGLLNDNTNRSIYWKLNEGSGTSITDSSGNSNNSTLNGSDWRTDVPGHYKTRSSV